MTRDEAIAILENEKKCVNRANKNDYCNRDCYNCELVKTDTEILAALDMAIKALEQEACEDCVSREEVLQALCKAVHKNDDTIPCSNQRVCCLWSKTKVQDYAEEILKLPSVNLQPCEDCISRQAAIDAFKPYAEYESNSTHADWVRRIELVLQDLPPVTPKPEIIKCKDCKFYTMMNRETKTGICNLTMHQNFGDDWFCAGAERRTDG